MARVSITIPDEVHERARDAGLNVSRVATSALSEELDRRAKIDALDDYLRELDVALGPGSAEDKAAARAWAARAFGDAEPSVMNANGTSNNERPTAPSRPRQPPPGTAERGRQPTVSHPKPTTSVPIARRASRTA